ncbi:MAG: hypothetical protein B7Y26_01660 [Hydrogenophilales bacterium 16-64-46]|nr:MAG: hypothetical protein B7Z32_01360 [Hydrogenophilales bacterium 12-64-13]OYZ06539.1 MAG: hypothetical protein B7Y26_01660 [Hydrogenophilales bacterium 16-64-46]OZA39247.1 MAG: hypothetical protein B7X87_02765 [Hydrogenophilales bacterium 17-64-34]HQS98800.1 hypothetical protein [Thiobacillus sp.]
MAFDRGDRTYHLSDERLKAFKALSTLEKLRWQEEIATFIRLTRLDPRAASGDSGTGQKMQEVGL